MTLAKVKALAAKLGAKVEEDKSYSFHCCRVEAPKGYTWKCSDVHELVDETNRPWKPDYADMLERMQYGVARCETEDCEWCGEA